MSMKSNLDHEPDRGPANDNLDAGVPANDNGQTVVSAPTGGALASLQGLETALSNVNTASVTGRSAMPMLRFKRDGNGTWWYGQRRTVPEAGSTWAVNPLTFKWGYICFGDGNKVLGEQLVPVSKPEPDVTKLPDLGAKWQEEWAVNLKCLSGADSGCEVTFKPTTVGGIQALAGLIETLRDRLNSNMHDGKVAPIVRLEKDSYMHSQHGRVWTPVLSIVDWMTLDGPAPTPAPAPAAPPSVDQPRRRRVG
jgi:hypothetical protein